MTYLPCTNCMQDILDPTNPSDAGGEFIHVLTLAVPCSVEDLPSDFARDVLHYGVTYVACPEDYSESWASVD